MVDVSRGYISQVDATVDGRRPCRKTSRTQEPSSTPSPPSGGCSFLRQKAEPGPIWIERFSCSLQVSPPHSIANPSKISSEENNSTTVVCRRNGVTVTAAQLEGIHDPYPRSKPTVFPTVRPQRRGVSSNPAADLPGDSTFVLKLNLNEQGIPSDIQVVKSLKSRLDAGVVNAVSHFRWHPAILDNQPVPTDLTLSMVVQN